jgi:hypothetical protein
VQIRELMATLDLGNSVAEFDAELKSYFVETQTFRALIKGDVDVIAGDKGTGKTALFRVLRERYREFDALKSVEILPAFNPSGNPVFQRLGQVQTLTEGQYATVWKSYLLALVGNWLLEIFGKDETESLKKLDELLTRIGLRSPDDSAQTIFSKLVNLVTRHLLPSSAEVGFSVTEAGMPVVTPKIEFGKTKGANRKPVEIVHHEDAFTLLNTCLSDLGVSVWVVLDRLDEAFQGFPAVERPALRALLRTYLDLLAYDNLKLKLFVRKDLFRKVVHGGFVNLTHVNARRLDIVWDEEDLKALLCNRIRRSKAFVEACGNPETDEQVFATLFPPQVDAGPRKPTTWAWMMSRIRDGNGIRPPRNLVDLAKKAQESQQRAEERTPHEYARGTPLIEPDALRKALQRLSEDRVNDTLLAEAADLAPMVEAFRDGKAEHNATTLSKLLDVPEAELKTAAKPLIEMGFLEEIAGSFKVPMLYRDGLSITQGKAFAPDAPPSDD